jgi:hypothetical protein
MGCCTRPKAGREGGWHPGGAKPGERPVSSPCELCPARRGAPASARIVRRGCGRWHSCCGKSGNRAAAAGAIPRITPKWALPPAPGRADGMAPELCVLSHLHVLGHGLKCKRGVGAELFQGGGHGLPPAREGNGMNPRAMPASERFEVGREWERSQFLPAMERPPRRKRSAPPTALPPACKKKERNTELVDDGAPWMNERCGTGGGAPRSAARRADIRQCLPVACERQSCWGPTRWRNPCCRRVQSHPAPCPPAKDRHPRRSLPLHARAKAGAGQRRVPLTPVPGRRADGTWWQDRGNPGSRPTKQCPCLGIPAWTTRWSR